jgi:hypothetical protein
MRLKFYLVLCPISSTPSDRKAQVIGYESVTEKEIFDYITRSGSSITMGELKAIYEEIIAAIDYFLKQGYGVNTEFVNIRPVITGVFEGDDDKFDPSRHHIKFKVALGKRYNHTADSVKAEKVIQPENIPMPQTFEDLGSGTVNETATPGRAATLKGQKLKFRQTNPLEGIFFVDSAKVEHRVEKILSITGKQVVFQIPEGLTPDEYSLEVRVQAYGSKEVKTGKLPESLTV